jgi:hypothetical protein
VATSRRFLYRRLRVLNWALGFLAAGAGRVIWLDTLASGRPAVIQDTGPSRHLDDRDGMRRFRTLDEAIAGIREIESDYAMHAAAARALAEEHFDARAAAERVLDHALG